MFQKHLRNSTEKVIHAINIGTMELANLRQSVFTPDFILLGLIEQDDSIVFKILKELSLEAQTILDVITERIYTTFSTSSSDPAVLPSNITLSVDVERLLEIATQEMKEFNDKFITTGSLFLAFFDSSILPASEILQSVGLSYEKCKEALISLRNGIIITARDGESQEDVLSVYGTDLTELAQQGKLDPVIGRDQDIIRVVEILARRTKNNPIIIGDAGIGKTVLIEGLAQLIINSRVPETLLNRKIIQLDIAQITAGAKFKGDFEERMKNVVDSLIATNGKVIAFIDEIQTLIDSNGGSIKAADILKPALTRGQIQLIGTTTTDNYRKVIEKDKGFSRRFQPVTLKEPTTEETIKILNGIKFKYEQHHGVVYEDKAIETAARLSSRYMNERYLPDKAIDLIDEAGARKKIFLVSTPPEVYLLETEKANLKRERSFAFKDNSLESVVELQNKINKVDAQLREIKNRWIETKNQNSNSVSAEDVALVISQNTGIPLSRIIETEAEKLVTMEERLHKRIIGQDAAVVAVSNAIRRNRTGIKDFNRPIGAFLFLGPTGVGKTEFAKVLAEFLFDDESKIVRLDMSEYMEKHSVSKMIGSPPGYVGYEEGGQLTEQIRCNPFSVILLDEMEKANEDVFNLMLQIFDEGKLTDSQGVEVSFKNTIIIGTSNLGSSHIFDLEKKIGFMGTHADNGEENYEVIKEKILEETKKFFKPEFLNRLDDIIVFHPLEKPHINAITALLLKKLETKIVEAGFTINFDPEIYDKIADLGYSQEFGARPLRRVIENYIENEISLKIITCGIQQGTHIMVKLKEDRIQVETEPRDPLGLEQSK